MMGDEGRRPLGELSFQLEKDAAVFTLSLGSLKRMRLSFKKMSDVQCKERFSSVSLFNN